MSADLSAMGADLSAMSADLSVAIGEPEGLTRFVAYTLLFVASFGVSYYAAANARHSPFSVLLWRYVSLATAVGSLFAAVAVAETIGFVGLLGFGEPIATAFRQLFQLFFIVFLALSMRELYFQIPHRERKDTALSIEACRRIETVFIAVIFVEFVIIVLIGFSTVASLVHVLGGFAFTIYGLSFAYSVRTETMTSGTVIDSVLTYTIAVLLTVGATSVVEGAAILGAPAITVQSAINVLTVMAGTFLIALVIRLKRNLNSIRVASG